MLQSLLIICISTALVVVAWAEPSPAPSHIVSHIPREPVQSSAIAKVGYSKRRHILEIEFVNGAVYRYFDIPLSVHHELMSAESKARFYDSNIRKHYRKVHASPALLDYLQDLLDASRQRHITGLSPRAGLALLHASQAWALMHGREMLLPEDIQAVGMAVMAHRLGHDLEQSGQSGRTLADNLLHSVPVP